MTTWSRTTAFERNLRQEETLREVNALLERAEQDAFNTESVVPKLPLIFIVGAPRTGTTLMLQWLASSGQFAYPSNLLARFFAAPYIGARIQQLITDPALDYRGELGDLREAISWKSDMGKTHGLLQPHEFFYFWRRFFSVDQAQKLTDEQLATADPEGFVKGWALIERAFEKPIAAKGILLQYDIRRLADWLPTSVFIHTKRDPLFTMQSLLNAREQVFGTREAWFAVRPPEFEWLRAEDPYTQVAGQVLFTDRYIEAGLEDLPTHRKMIVKYEQFCEAPFDAWRRLREALAHVGYSLPFGYEGPVQFRCMNAIRGSARDRQSIRSAYEKLLGQPF